MSGHPDAVTSEGCPLCDGPCREPLHIPAVNPRYPFLRPDQIKTLRDRDTPAPPPEPTPAGGRRRRVEDRMRRLQETTSRQPTEDR